MANGHGAPRGKGVGGPGGVSVAVVSGDNLSRGGV